MVYVSVVVPTYNEQEVIGEFIERLNQALEDLDYELIIVDDSVDFTASVAKKYMEKFGIKGFVIKRGKRLGKGSAVNLGMKKAKGSYVFVIDADLEYNPFDIKRLLKLLEARKCSVVVGRRLRKGSFVRKFVGFVFRIVTWLLFGMRIDTQSGLKGFERRFCKVDIKTKGWVWDVEFLMKAIYMGAKICEIPIIFGRRGRGKSKIKVFDAFYMLFDLVEMRRKFRKYLH